MAKKFPDIDHSRIDALGDGIYAIVLTLLGLDVVGAVMHIAEEPDLNSALLHEWPIFLAFVLALIMPCSGLFMRFAWMVQPRNYLLLACHVANESVQVASPLLLPLTHLHDPLSKRNSGEAFFILRKILILRTDSLRRSGPINRRQLRRQRPAAAAPRLQSDAVDQAIAS
jgi:hypothetical protein